MCVREREREQGRSVRLNGRTGWQESTVENGHSAVGTLGTIMDLGKEGGRSWLFYVRGRKTRK